MKKPQLFVCLVTTLLLSHGLVSTIQAQGVAPKAIPNNATIGSSHPNIQLLHNNQIFLSWQEKASTGRTLYFSALKKGSFNKPQAIKQGKGWYTGWADPASITAFGKQSLVATFSMKGGKGHAQFAGITISNDRGKTWSNPIIIHDDRTATEHGFISIVPTKGERFWAVWLDGRAYEKFKGQRGKGYTVLRTALFDKNGRKSNEQVLDNRVCDCCQTTAVNTQSGVVVMYRDRSQKEQRDIGYVVLKNGQWSKPQSLHNDSWVIRGCPVNGPSLATYQDNVAVSWFTMGNQESKVQLSFSNNGGTTFSKPILLDKTGVMGRVNTQILQTGDAIVSYVTNEDEKRVVKILQVSPKGKKTLLTSIDSLGNSNDFPKTVVSEGKLYIAWSERQKDKPQVKTAWVKLSK